jgi:hypothetical protein
MNPRHQSTALHPLGLDFDGFLYAPVGDDRHGGLLSVISALARVGVDPWDEAASLARLPAQSAVLRLSALLAKLPEGTGKPADPVPVAAHLVTLLPHGPMRPAALHRGAVSRDSPRTGPDYRLMALACALYFLMFMVVQVLLQHRTATETAPPVSPPPHATVTVPAAPAPTLR